MTAGPLEFVTTPTTLVTIKTRRVINLRSVPTASRRGFHLGRVRLQTVRRVITNQGITLALAGMLMMFSSRVRILGTRMIIIFISVVHKVEWVEDVICVLLISWLAMGYFLNSIHSTFLQLTHSDASRRVGNQNAFLYAINVKMIHEGKAASIDVVCVPTRDTPTPKNEVTNRDKVSALQCPSGLQALYIKLHLDPYSSPFLHLVQRTTFRSTTLIVSILNLSSTNQTRLEVCDSIGTQQTEFHCRSRWKPTAIQNRSQFPHWPQSPPLLQNPS